MQECRIFDRKNKNLAPGVSGWDNPRKVTLTDDQDFPKFIFIGDKYKRAFKRKEFEPDGYYERHKYHRK